MTKPTILVATWGEGRTQEIANSPSDGWRRMDAAAR